MKEQKNIILSVVVLLILGSIIYLESKKNSPLQDAQVLTLPEQTATSSNASTTNTAALQKSKAEMYPRAVELAGIKGYVNTPPFTLQSLVGNKVVLVDFWTYSCINCQRTIPYLNAWYQKYKDFGLEIVGVHTPEFDFEKDQVNVEKAVKADNIQYKIVLDSDMGTWNAYKNRYWPHELLIDIDGYIIHDHIGEGSYDETEKAIQAALKERSDRLGLHLSIPGGIVSPTDAVNMDPTKVQSQETYFGSSRSISGSFKLEGTWDIKPEYAKSTSLTSKILYTYNAKNVYFVASSPNGSTIDVLRDGVSIDTQKIEDNKLYTLIQGTDYGEHTLEIDVTGPGLEAFTLTFG